MIVYNYFRTSRVPSRLKARTPSHLPHMARLFTSKPVHQEDHENDVEIHLEPLDAQDSENVLNTGNMTVAPLGKPKINGIAIKKRLNGTWMKLANLPPQELVSELKVNICFFTIEYTLTLYFIGHS